MRFTCFCCSGHFPYCIILFLRASHPLPDQPPGEHTGPCLTQGSTSFIIRPFSAALLHSFLADRSTVVGHVPMNHTCSFMCTSHIDMTAHNPAFLQVG